MKRGHHDSSRGAALVLALVLLVIVGLGTSLAFRQLNAAASRLQDRMRAGQARYLAEAAIALATAQLNQEAPRWEQSAPLGGGQIEYRITPRADGCFEVVATGRVTDGELTLAQQVITLRICGGENGFAITQPADGGASL